MRIPKYWARKNFIIDDEDSGGGELVRSALGWSYESQAEADQMASERAEKAVKNAENYDSEFEYYDDIPIREPLLKEINIDNQNIGLITRNRYGCRVLNAESVLFADIDLTYYPKPRSRRSKGFISRLVSLFTKPAPQPVEKAIEPESLALERIGSWCAQTGIGARVYRTFAGIRLMVTDRLFDPTSSETMDVLQTLKSDPLYVQLTKRQDCFRARLSPKPWRIGVTTPPFPSPTDHPEYPQILEKWAVNYESKARSFATCRLIRTFGNVSNDPAIQTIIQLHDSAVINGDAPLA